MKRINDFDKRAIKIHGNKYDYSQSIYKNTKTKVKIICRKHGEFYQTPGHHLEGHGCSYCCGHKIKNIKDFIKEGSKVHNNKYDYNLAQFVGVKTKLCIKCPKHGIFEQTPDCHINHRQGCPKCNFSKGERLIESYLINNNIKYESQYRIPECKNIRTLPFDFAIWINEKLYLIEFHGRQHYECYDFLENGKIAFEDCRNNDKIKYDFCFKNNINLTIIKYTQISNIKDILNKVITEIKWQEEQL